MKAIIMGVSDIQENQLMFLPKYAKKLLVSVMGIKGVKKFAFN